VEGSRASGDPKSPRFRLRSLATTPSQSTEMAARCPASPYRSHRPETRAQRKKHFRAAAFEIRGRPTPPRHLGGKSPTSLLWLSTKISTLPGVPQRSCSLPSRKRELYHPPIAEITALAVHLVQITDHGWARRYHQFWYKDRARVGAAALPGPTSGTSRQREASPAPDRIVSMHLQETAPSKLDPC